AARIDPFLDRRPFELAGALGARQRSRRPDRYTADLLVFLELGIGAADYLVLVGAVIEHEHGVDALAADDRTVAHTGNPAQHELDVVREDLEPFGRDNHLVLAPAHGEIAVAVERADVGGMEPSVLEGSGSVRGRADVAGRNDVAAHEDLAVGGDSQIDAGQRLTHRSGPQMERMVEGDDRRGLGQAVALRDEEAECAPELLEARLQRRAADDQADELPSEQPMDPAVTPAAHEPRRAIL